jgi:class I fructose-bisphosphate aldolase
MLERARCIIKEAKSYGLFTIIWSYPRGEDLNTADETAIDVVSYGAHIAALIGAHIIKVKMPTDHVRCTTLASQYREEKIDLSNASLRVAHVVRSCFCAKRLVLFSGGEKKEYNDVLDDAHSILTGGGSGSIIARNCFKRPWEEALNLVGDLVKIYKSI